MAHLWDAGEETIAALATAAGSAARGVVRVSGPAAVTCTSRLFRPSAAPLESLTRATVVGGELELGGPLGPVPCELYVWPTTHSYTREPLVELHLPGSIPLLQAALVAVCAAGARLARPGEFTLRAFLAGRLDLTQAEAVLGVIQAQDDRELQIALGQLAGGLNRPLQQLREDLLNLLAHLEAGLDFVEEDIEFISRDELCRSLRNAQNTIEDLVRRMQARTTRQGAYRVVLRGWPNVGKSSLFNALLGQAAALVADQPGTTRDYLAGTLALEGMMCELIDTAGVTPASALSADPLRNAMQAATSGQAAGAHLEIFCIDASRPLNAWERQQLLPRESPPPLVVWTKADRFDPSTSQGREPVPALMTSSRTGQGLDRLRDAIRGELVRRVADAAGMVGATSVRCRTSLHEALESLRRALQLLADGGSEELLAAELRETLDALSRVVGAIYTDDILDRIFRRFCIGK